MPNTEHHPERSDVAPRPEPGLDDLVRDTRAARERARELADRPPPGSEITLSTATGPDAIKTRVAQQRSGLERATKDLERRRDELTDRLRREIAALNADLEPLRRRVDQLQELVWTVNLYLGRDEQIVTLLDGDPAPAETPIVVRQMVLSMDEESMIAATHGGIDFRNLDAFDAWVSDPQHLQQVLPETRGVVVLVPRRRGRDYGDAMFSSVLNKENTRSYWLIRNGERLFRMSTEFSVGDLLTPARHEFAEYFTESRYNWETRQTETVPLEPGSSAWLRAEEKSDARRRHYMRAALILQGLVDRTTVFAPLPAAQVSLLQSHSYDAGHVVLISDAESTIGSGRAPFYTWLAELNSQLRVGMRVVCAFNSERFKDMRSHESYNFFEHERLYPRKAETPDSGTAYVIEERRADGGLLIRYARTENVFTRDDWGRHEYRAPRTRASCLLYPTDKFVLPIDLADVDDMRAYLESRTERHAYLDMLPLLRNAIAVREAEAAAEEPFRALLAGQIALTHDVPVDEAVASVEALVRWWKLTTVHFRPLVAGEDPDTERRAIEAIVTEFAARRAAAAKAELDADHNARIVRQLRDQITDPLLIARTRDGGFVALAVQPRNHPEPIAQPRVYVREYTTGTRAQSLKCRDWVIPTRARVDRWTVLWTAPGWSDWDLAARRAVHLTDPEIDELVDELRAAGAVYLKETVTYPGGKRKVSTEPAGAPAVITCTGQTSGRADLRLYLDDRAELAVPERLLTGQIPPAEVRRLRMTWRRGAGSKVERTVIDELREIEWGTTSAFGHEPELRAPWHDETILWADDQQIARTRGQAAAMLDAKRAASALSGIAGRARRVVARAWEARAEAEAYQRFLDDYRDPDLWEGHRKTLRINYPHVGSFGRDGLTRLLDRLVEDGHDLTGHTVATAAALLGEDIDLPEDIHDLPLTADPEEE
jgi:hypothetical protein